MKLTIFDYRDYKKYLKDWILSHPERGRGMKSEIAQAIQCQKAYVSQVLSGAAHFSLEQADSLNAFMNHSPAEAHYFFLILQYARAGKVTLEKYFEAQIEQVIEQRLVLKDRLQIKDSLSPEVQATYYSAWYFAAIHMLIGIEKFQSKDAIGKALGLSPKIVKEVLDFLVSTGLASQVSLDRFRIGPTRIHLDRDSPMIPKHHTNWRMQAIRSLEKGAQDELHYSVVLSLARRDLPNLKKIIVNSIQELMKNAHESQDEELHCFNLDFFSI